MFSNILVNPCKGITWYMSVKYRSSREVLVGIRAKTLESSSDGSNPHCFLTFDVNDDNGPVVHWVVETQPPRSITAGGFSQHTFKPGDEVTVTLEPVKNGQPLGRMLEVLLPNGKKLVTGHLD